MNGDFSQKDKEEKNNEKSVEQDYLDALCRLVDVLFKKGIYVVFYFDKIESGETWHFLRPLIKTSGVTTVMVVERPATKPWATEAKSSRIFYVPRIWDIGNRILDCMTGQKNIDSSLLGYFIDYLNFYSQGIPGNFVRLVDKNQYFQIFPKTSNSFLKKMGLARKVEQQNLIIKESEYQRIKAAGKLNRSIKGVLDQYFLGESEEVRDQKKSAIYETLQIFLDNALDRKLVKFGFRKFSDTLVAQFKFHHYHGVKNEIDAIASKIINDLKQENLIQITNTGIDLSPLVKG